MEPAQQDIRVFSGIALTEQIQEGSYGHQTGDDRISHRHRKTLSERP